MLAPVTHDTRSLPLRDLPISSEVIRARVCRQVRTWPGVGGSLSVFLIAQGGRNRGRRRLNAVGISIDSDWYRRRSPRSSRQGADHYERSSTKSRRQLGYLLEDERMSVSLEDRMPFLDARLLNLRWKYRRRSCSATVGQNGSATNAREVRQTRRAWKEEGQLNPQRETFDPRDSDVHRVINQSSILRELPDRLGGIWRRLTLRSSGVRSQSHFGRASA